MHFSLLRSRKALTVGMAVLTAVVLVSAEWSRAADYGRLAGTVKDTEGSPLMGATVVLTGPILSLGATSAVAERVITDAHGDFSIEHLLPGRYSLQVTSPTRVPVRRNGIVVSAGESTKTNFVLADFFSAVRLQSLPNLTTWGEDWKWVLRSAAATRPVLRYQEVAKANPPRKGAKQYPLPSQRLIGMIPGSGRHNMMSSDPGIGSVLAYLRPISDNSDLLVSGSYSAGGLQGSSFATAFRRNVLKDDPQELSIAVHQLNSTEDLPVAWGNARGTLNRSQLVVFSYSRTRQLWGALSLSSGVEIDYLNAVRDAMVAHPKVKLEYRLNSSNEVALGWGTASPDSNGSLLDRVGDLNAFPRVTLSNFHPRLQSLNHLELGLEHKLSKSARVEVASYRDDFENTAVSGFGRPQQLGWLAGSVLPNPAVDGMIFNAGRYSSSGVRAAYVQKLGNNIQVAAMYTLGDALAFRSPGAGMNSRELCRMLHASSTRAAAGKISARLPRSNTELITSYEWIERGHVTSVDPYGQNSLEVQPFWDLQIRQPLPTLAFMPAHIEALADFRNLLAQGYVRLAGADEPLVLTPAYRSFRGGFSVQF